MLLCYRSLSFSKRGPPPRLGLGIPVVWTCRDTDIDKAHFDTRQYNHIVWTDSDDLKEKLIARIEATVPLKAFAEGVSGR